MRIEIDNFTITETPDAVELRFRRSFKDWFDLTWSTIFTAFAGWLMWFVFHDGLQHLPAGKWAFGIFISIIAVLLAGDLWSRLVSPAGKLAWIDKSAKSLTIRPSIFSKRTYPLHEVGGFTSSNKGSRPSILHYIRRSMPRTLRLRLKRGGTVPLVHLSTIDIINLGNRQPRTDAILRAKRVAEEMNRYINQVKSSGERNLRFR